MSHIDCGTIEGDTVKGWLGGVKIGDNDLESFVNYLAVNASKFSGSPPQNPGVSV